MRVFQIADSYGPAGGLERFIHNFSRRLIEVGCETRIAALHVDSDNHWGNSRDIEVTQMMQTPAAWVDNIRIYNPDVVAWHVSPSTANVAAVVASQYPTVATVHGVVCPSEGRLFRDRDEVCGHQSGLSCLARWYMRQCGTSKLPHRAIQGLHNHKAVIQAMHQCERVYAVSKSVQSHLLLEGISPENVRVFDSTLGQMDQLPDLSQSARGDTLRLLYVGRLAYEKGVQYLIRAVRELRDLSVNVTCDIVGDGWYRSKLEHLVRQLDVSNIIHFHGNLPGYSMEEWYQKTDIVVVPSIWPEPSALVVPEARAQGKPVIVSDAGGLPEWQTLTDGIYVVKHADIESLVDVICDLRAVGQGKEFMNQFNSPRGGKSRIDILSDLRDIQTNQNSIHREARI